ncbi:beta-galactosidase-like [Pelodytes ibericus]
MGARLLSILLVGYVFEQAKGERYFLIDYAENCFKKDGKCFRYISGSIHYFRIPAGYWRDRLLKMYMTGLNAIDVYVPWNFHELESGVFDFRGDRDIEHFLSLADKLGLLVIIRPGPYICSEWDMGGLPAWLLIKKDIALRRSNPDYLNAVDTWLSVLLPKIRPHLYNNGGNVISVQVENEYGSFPACDYSYLHHLYGMFRQYLGNDVVLFTTDGNSEKVLHCGTMPGLYATVDFGPVDNGTKAFELLRRLQPKGPLVNSEYYTGWMDHWGEQHSIKSSESVCQGLLNILYTGASVNMYMFEGGTNFGYWNGANIKVKYQSVTTSYDYDAPLTEAGDPTEKLHKIRAVISKFLPVPQGPFPRPSPKYHYGPVMLQKIGSLLELLNVFSPAYPIGSQYPITFEDARQYFGFMLYRTQLPSDIRPTSTLTDPLNGVRDRAYVMLNGYFSGVLERDTVRSVTVLGSPGEWLDIVVENMGRVNYGVNISDFKGLVSNLTLGGNILTDWLAYPLDIDGPIAKGWPHILGNNSVGILQTESHLGPVVYSGSFTISAAGDTFLNMSQWSKGQVWINGLNIGRYWSSRGPQITLYVPGCILNTSIPNNLTVLELEKSPAHAQVVFQNKHVIQSPMTGP